jgi:lycopene beta-cyclase
LQAAPRVAAALQLALGSDQPATHALAVWDAVWPADARRARALHDFGQAALLRLDSHQMQAFFDAFFDVPTDWWSAYLRVHATPVEVARVMSAVFSSVPWSVRRRLAAGNPMVLARLLQ